MHPGGKQNMFGDNILLQTLNKRSRMLNIIWIKCAYTYFWDFQASSAVTNTEYFGKNNKNNVIDNHLDFSYFRKWKLASQRASSSTFQNCVKYLLTVQSNS